jgi:putative Mn2+ efflux pump MntP
MIREAFHLEKEKKPKKDPTKGMTLVVLSVATSIDALAVGLSLAVIKISIWVPALVIGIVATLFTGMGLYLGKKVGASSCLSSYADVVGGVVLLGIGLKILHEHGALLP